MKIRIDITVEVNEDDWNREYGTTAPTQVRNDVIAHTRAALAAAPVPIVPIRRC